MRRKRTICEKQHAALRTFGLTALTVLCLVSQSNADTAQVWTLNASCLETIEALPCVDPANISATFTTQMVLDTFVDPSGTGVPSLQTEPEIQTLTGTFDGMPMTLTVGNAWVDMQVSFPQMLYFAAGNQSYILFWDGAPKLDLSNSPDEEILNGNAIDPIPEPAEWIMLLGGLDALLIAAWFRRKL